MATVVGLTIVKRFPYRDTPAEEWSNQYWLTGAVPSVPAGWRQLWDAIVAEERKLYPGHIQVIRGYGYNSDSDDAVAVWSVDLTVAPETPLAGSFVPGAGKPLCPGDAAMWVRWKTTRMNSKGKPIYLRKYFHGVALKDANGGDEIVPTQQTALLTFADRLSITPAVAGYTVRSRLHSETVQSFGVSKYATTRTLKRRGKRPGS